MSFISFLSKTVAYSDTVPTSQPLRKHFDWARTVRTSVSNPKSADRTIPAGGSYTFFNTVETTGIDNTTAFTVTQSPLGTTRYRFTATGGTSPALRTDRALTLTGQAVTMTINVDGSVTLSVGAGSLAAVQAGDQVFIPGPVTGDAATPFSAPNQGLWTVLAQLSTTSLQLQRPANQAFNASSETVTLTSNSQLQAFTAAGVQVGDKVKISAAFAASTRKTFTVLAVTPTWFEIASGSPIALETGKLPTATGMIFYSGSTTYLRVEADQVVSVRLNGDTSDNLQAQPMDAADAEMPGWLELWGPVWSLTVVNLSTQSTKVDVFTAE